MAKQSDMELRELLQKKVREFAYQYPGEYVAVAALNWRAFAHSPDRNTIFTLIDEWQHKGGQHYFLMSPDECLDSPKPIMRPRTLDDTEE